MSYDVVWTPDAHRDLAAVWNAAADRKAVTAAAAGIDRVLALIPLH